MGQSGLTFIGYLVSSQLFNRAIAIGIGTAFINVSFSSRLTL
ncbi:hypothetical protein [Oculatella sp. LEGE 06141]|nr:hypothetical protein [Oculatella sp. LEGE 06141]